MFIKTYTNISLKEAEAEVGNQSRKIVDVKIWRNTVDKYDMVIKIKHWDE